MTVGSTADATPLRGRPDVSDHDAPKTDRRLQDAQDPDAPETRPDEAEGASTTPIGQTDVEQDDEQSTSPGD
jgi:hypothetical protein